MNFASKLKKLVIVPVVVILGVIVTACGGQPTAEPVQVNTTNAPASVVSAEAYVVPLREADLSFKVSGQVSAIEVKEGAAVSQGEVLARLTDSDYQVSLDQAEAQLNSARASLAETEAGPTADQITQSEASLAKAEAYLAQLLAGPTPEDIAQAEAKVATAQASLDQVLAGSRDEDTRASAAQLLKAEANVQEAQADYDANVYGDPDRLGPFGLALQEATLNYEAAKADYDRLVNGSTDEEIAVYRSQLKEAQAALATAKAGSTAEQIAQAQADVLSAQAALADLKAGASPEQIGVAEAGVKAAEVDMAKAQLELNKTTLKAPFDGTVGHVDMNVGEMISAGAAVVSLADVSAWQIETDDLNELDVVGVIEGATVKISVDALPDEVLEGRVERITPKSVTKAGDVTYTTLIEITGGDTSRLRWGMTVVVDIDVAPAS